MKVSQLMLVVLVCLLMTGQSALQDNYCQVNPNATHEIKMELKKSATERSVTEIIFKSQSFASNNKTLGLSYIQDGPDIFIEETGSDLKSVVHTQSIDKDLIFIDARDEYIIAKEIKDLEAGDVQYVLFKANIGTAGQMQSFIISVQKLIQSEDISDMTLTKILEITDTEILFILAGEEKTAIFQTTLASPGNLTMVAVVAQRYLNVLVGNSKILLDGLTFHAFQLRQAAGGQQFVELTLVDLGFSPKVQPDNIDIVELSGGVMVFLSYFDGITNVLAIDKTPLDLKKIIVLQGVARFFTDRYKNVAIKGQGNGVLIRVTPTETLVKQLSMANTNSTEMVNIFMAISAPIDAFFDGDFIMVVNQEIRNKMASMNILKFDGTTISFVEGYKNSLDLVKGDFPKMIQQKEPGNYETFVGCNCVSHQISKFECFSNGLKCITVTTPKREDCTKAA